MLFSSLTFIYIFLPTIIFIYYILLRKSRFLQNLFLFMASLVFYAWGEPKFVLLLILSIIVNWLFGIIIDKKREYRKIAKLLIGIDILFNLSLLFVFKYLVFTGRIIQYLFGINLQIPNIVLPIGISFFTFQAMSYVIDVYRQKGKVQSNLLYVGLYISFFPQLIAGPIVRYETIANEIENRKENSNDFFDGFARFVIGLSKKVLLANSFVFLVDQTFNAVKDGENISVLFGWLGAIAYTFQVFFDFSGYSDMAIGMGRMFGFHFLENFNYPYISTSVTEFWRRWHISLGTWFKDYLYIPLGGSRCSLQRNIFNLFVVWFLTGLWHGANMNYIVWGLMYFLLLVFEKSTGFVNKDQEKFNALKWLYTIVSTMIGLIIFRSENMHDALLYLKYIFGLNRNAFIDEIFIGWFTQHLLLLVIGAFLCTPIFKYISHKTKNNEKVKVLKLLGLIFLLVLSIANLVSSSYNPFIYFNF